MRRYEVSLPSMSIQPDADGDYGLEQFLSWYIPIYQTVMASEVEALRRRRSRLPKS
jgi:hypothetical protein